MRAAVGRRARALARRSSTTTCSTAPRCAAGARRSRRARAARRRPRPATCCSRARSPSSPPTVRRRRCARSRTPARRSPRASCCSARTPGTPSRRRALPAPLRAEDRAAVRGGLPARRPEAGGGRRRRRARRVRRAHRARLPAPRRRARRLRPGRAHGQAARHRPARRHGHAAADPRARARPALARSTCARSTPGQAEELCDRDRRDGRAGRGARAGAGRSSPRPRRGCRTLERSAGAGRRRQRRRPRQPWSTALRRRLQSRAQRAAPRSPGEDVVGVSARRSARPRLPCSRASCAEVAHERLGAAVELLVEAFDASCSKTPSRPLAVGAAQGDLPVPRAGLLPSRGRRGPTRSRGRRAGRPVGVLGRPVGGPAAVGEVDDLDRLATGQHYAPTDVSVGCRAGGSS